MLGGVEQADRKGQPRSRLLNARREAVVLTILIAAVMLLIWNGSAFFNNLMIVGPEFGSTIRVASIALTLNVALILLLSVLVFVPIKFPYPTKTKPLRPLTLACGGIWGVMMLVLLFTLPSPPMWIAWGSLVFVAYYLGLTFWLWWRRRSADPALA